MNDSLKRTLRMKEEEISHFQMAYGSIRRLINDLDQQEHNPPIKENKKITTKSFIKLARNELTCNEFRQMMLHVNSYNQRLKTKDEMMESIKTLLWANHSMLFDQFSRLMNPSPEGFIVDLEKKTSKC